MSDPSMAALQQADSLSRRAARCPICEQPTPEPFIRIPSQPVHVGLLWDSPDDARHAPRGDIDLSVCTTCGHIFNATFDPCATEYGGTYDNSLHHSAVFQEYAAQLVSDLIERYDIRDKDIVEAGAGQGDFLRMLCAAGGNRGTGFDPSALPEAGPSQEDSLVRVVPEYYGPQFADQPADLIVCRHVLEHIDRAGDFVRMLRGVIGRRSTLTFFEVPNALRTLEVGAVWDIIYEHCGYFTPLSLTEVFRRAEFRICRTETAFGDQFLTVEAQPADGVEPRPTLADREAQRVVESAQTFAGNVQAVIDEWRAQISEMANSGQSVVAWGAGAKGVTFMNIVDPERSISHVVDVNPRKNGRFLPGVGQPIIAPDRLPSISPDVVIIMNPNYRAEIEATLARLGVSAEVIVA